MPKSRNRIYYRNQNGFIAAFVAILMPVFIGVMALSIDLPRVFSFNTDIKSALDLASTAGISQLMSADDITLAKTTALTYINNNLTMTLPNFTDLTIIDPNLSLQCGVYDPSTMIWTFDEADPNVNSLKITYTYTPESLLSQYFMINSFPIMVISLAGKSYAGVAGGGTSFPFALDPSALTSAAADSNMVRIYQTGDSQNSYLSDYTGNSSEVDLTAEANYFRGLGGTPPPSTSIGLTYMVFNGSGQIENFYLNNLNPWTPTFGTIFIFPVATSGVGNTETIRGYVGGTIDGFGITGMIYYTDLTLYPKTADNTWGGLITGSQPSALDATQLSFLATGAGLLQ